MKQLQRCRRIVSLLCLALAITVSPSSAAEPVRARQGMVVSASDIASQVGVDVLKQGGNAVDAAVAVGLALAVTHPTAGNIGGGGFMLIRLADGRTTAIDYRETAPDAATREMFLNASGEVEPEASTVGYRAAGVPGTVAGLGMALEQYGTMSWATLIEPARKLAADGFTVSTALADELREEKVLAKFPETRRIFLKDGEYYRSGDVFRQPDLAETLQRLKEHGPREFYQGHTAKLIVNDMRANNGLITHCDLDAYRPAVRTPLRGTYRGYEIITMPPPSSGGIALIEMLNMLEIHDLKAMGHNTPDSLHLMIEAMRRAFADRAEFLGDPDFVEVPVAGLISKDYARTLTTTIDSHRASRSAAMSHGNPPRHESPQTTHFSIVDAMGNAVANTYTLNTNYGSGVTVKGAGFLLNNEMDDFTSKPGAPNAYGLIQSEKNAIERHKRPLSSMTPTIVLKNDQPFLVIGSPGGPTIINTVLQVLVNVIDHDMNIHEAIEAPRVHHQWMPDQVRWDDRGLSNDVRAALEKKGHQFEEKPRPFGEAEGIMIQPTTGDRVGANDPRCKTGAAVGY